MIQGIIIPLLNRLVQHDPAVQDVCSRHNGKVIRLTLTEWPTSLWILFTRSGLVLLDQEVPHDGAVTWSIVDAHAMLLSPTSPHTLQLSGSIAFLQDTFQAFSSASWDIFPFLADHLGVYAAGMLTETLGILRDCMHFMATACGDTLKIQLHKTYCSTSEHKILQNTLYKAQRALEHLERRVTLLCT